MSAAVLEEMSALIVASNQARPSDSGCDLAGLAEPVDALERGDDVGGRGRRR